MRHARDDYNRIQDPANKIPIDEPVFLLRAQDMLAPGLLAIWANELLIRGGSNDRAKEAIDHAQRMIAWQELHGCKLPD